MNINNKILKRMFISAFNNVSNNCSKINEVNFYPVPDHDTGTNIKLTMSNGIEKIKEKNEDVLASFADGLFEASCGNSGMIISQMFLGLSEFLKCKKEINAVDFANAIVCGKDASYRAVSKPKDGTILTVIKNMSAKLLEEVNKKNDISIEKCFEILLNEGKNSLNLTKSCDFNTFDSGAVGLIFILEGMHKVLLNKDVSLIENKTNDCSKCS